MKYPIASFLAFALAFPASAELRPQPESVGDPRVQSVEYDPNEVVLIEAVEGYQVTVQFAPGEQIDSIAVGNSGAWQVTANRRGDLLFVKLTQSGVASNMTVATDARTYAFTLVPTYGTVTPYTIRFRYPEPAQALIAPAGAAPSTAGWRLSGAVALRPHRIEATEDHIYLEWPSDAKVPAVFVVADRQEALVNGMMRDGAYVIDGTPDQLVFRIGDRSAGARRTPARKKARP